MRIQIPFRLEIQIRLQIEIGLEIRFRIVLGMEIRFCIEVGTELLGLLCGGAKAPRQTPAPYPFLLHTLPTRFSLFVSKGGVSLRFGARQGLPFY